MAKDHKEEQTTICHIRLLERVDIKWADWFGDYVLTPLKGGAALLSGVVNDQSELLGMLERVHNLGMSFDFFILAPCLSGKEECSSHGNPLKCFLDQDLDIEVPDCTNTMNEHD